jgi:hypothetical protein
LNGTLLNMSQTWGGTGTYTGIKYDVTDSGPSNAASLLMDLQVGGTPQVRVSKAGRCTVNDITLWSNETPGGTASKALWAGPNSTIALGRNGSAYVFIAGNGFGLPNANTLGWGYINTGGSADLEIGRRAAANLRFGAADTSASATVTITIAAPGVVTWNSHSLSTGTPVIFSTDGALPTGITAGTTYYAVVVNANTFQIATSFANAIAATPTVVTTSGSQSGTHTARRGAIAQTLSVQDTLSSGSLENIDGANLVINGSRSIGNKPGGSIIFQVAPAGSTGTAQNALATTAQFGPFQGKLYLGSASPTSSNYAIWGDGTNTWVNAPTSGGFVHFGSLDNWGVAVHPASVRISSGVTLGWTASNPAAALDLILTRDAANTLALRNGGTSGTPVPQAFRVYNWFDGTNGEFGGIRWASNVFTIGPQTAGTGIARATSFVDGSGAERININASNGVVTVANMQLITSGGISYIGAEAAGLTLRYASGSNTDMMVRFAGNTSSFPALKRSSTSLIVRLADDTANAALESASLKTDAPTGGTSGTWKLGTVATFSPTSPNRTIEVDIGGTIYYLAAKTTND